MLRGLRSDPQAARCREPALAAYEAEEVLQRGSLAFVSSLASSVASGVLGVAKAAAWGRQSGYRAGLTRCKADLGHVLHRISLQVNQDDVAHHHMNDGPP